MGCGGSKPAGDSGGKSSGGGSESGAFGIQHAHRVPNHWLTASSEWGDAGPHLSRLHQNRPNSSCWAPAHPGEAAKQSWIQIDLQHMQTVTAVATQGNSATTYGHQWTTGYNISYSEDGRSWSRYPVRTLVSMPGLPPALPPSAPCALRAWL